MAWLLAVALCWPGREHRRRGLPWASCGGRRGRLPNRRGTLRPLEQRGTKQALIEEGEKACMTWCLKTDVRGLFI